MPVLSMQPCKSKGLSWPLSSFSRGILWLQRRTPTVTCSGGNTAHQEHSRKRVKKIPYLRTENLKNHTLFHSTYLYSSCMGVPPGGIVHSNSLYLLYFAFCSHLKLTFWRCTSSETGKKSWNDESCCACVCWHVWRWGWSLLDVCQVYEVFGSIRNTDRKTGNTTLIVMHAMQGTMIIFIITSLSYQ